LIILVQIVFWLAALLILQAYVGYPVGIYLKSRRIGDERSEALSDSQLPSITVVIPAYNEAQWIARKIENALAFEYPSDRRQIVIACDGCTDDTVTIAYQYAGRGVEVQHSPVRSGKPALLNRVVPTVQGEIVLVTDAAAHLPPETLRWLAHRFQDADVGCVTGPRVCIPTLSAASEGEGLYFRYEGWIKESESRLGTCLGANGQVMAVRKSLFPQIPEINDDFYVAMKILVVDRAKVVFEPRAKALVPAAANLRQELERKVRTNTGFLREMPYLVQALNPRKSVIWWRFFSHHVLRRVVPFAMVTVCAASFLLWKDSNFYRAAALAQVTFYMAAFFGFLLERGRLRFRIFYFLFYFCFANVAVLLAWIRYVRGKQAYAWQKTERILPQAQTPHPANRKPA
jgi:biofilm PGA synthesis N-glycosyltransferase PgaC